MATNRQYFMVDKRCPVWWPPWPPSSEHPERKRSWDS